MRVGLMEPGDPEFKAVEIEPDDAGGYLHALQGLVGGPLEHFDALLGDRPCLIVNEEGIIAGMEPNRAVFANERMESVGYLSMLDLSSTVREGELYSVLCGPIVAASYGEDGELASISDAELAAASDALGGEYLVGSGLVAAAAVKLGIEIRDPRLADLERDADDAAAASSATRAEDERQREER